MFVFCSLIGILGCFLCSSRANSRAPASLTLQSRLVHVRFRPNPLEEASMAGSLLFKEVQPSLICPTALPLCGKRFHTRDAEFRAIWNPKRSRKSAVHCATFGCGLRASVVCSPLQRAVTFYEVLGVSQGSSDSELKDAYRSRVKEYHPDHAPPDKAQEYQKKFMEVHRAYNVLKDPERRSIYDFEIKNSRYAANWTYEEKTGQWRGRNWETDQCWTS